MLVVLVALDGNGGKSGVACDGVGLSQIAVTGGEAAMEQLENVDLAAGGSQAVEIEIVDVDIASR